MQFILTKLPKIVLQRVEEGKGCPVVRQWSYGEDETMGCYMADYRACVGTWAVRISRGLETSRCTVQGNGHVILCLETMVLSATTLAVLLVIGGVQTNPGPGVETEKIMRVLCSGCDRILKSGTQCDTCGRWFHNIYGNVKAQVVESGKWVCDKCRSERLRVLEEKLQDALHQIDALTRKNKTLEEQLQLLKQLIYFKVCRCIYRIISNITWGKYKYGTILQLIIQVIYISKFVGVYVG
jgi:hypothetical protein